MPDKSYIGKGKVYLDGRELGNVTELTISVEEDKKELQDYTSAGGGLYNSLSRISNVSMAMSLSDYSGDNLSMALFGSNSAHTGAAQTDEAQSAPATLNGNMLVKTDHVIDTTVSPVVTGTGGTPTYTEGTDYEVSPGGIIIIDGGGITGGTALEIDYTSKSVDVVQALVNSAQEYELVFDGLNEAQSGAPVVITIFRAKFGAAQDLSVIGDEFGAIALSGDSLKDTTITTAGLSQYIKIQAA